MNVVILQPSYIPWRGYFDQIRQANLFIFYDDIQYDKHGWRNRNQIKTAQGKQWITIPVHSKGVTNGIPIKDVRIDWSKPWAKKHLNTLTYAYAKTPFIRSFRPWLEAVYNRRDEFLADFIIDTTVELAGKLGITGTKFIRSSEIKNIEGQKTDRLIQILQHVGAQKYISGPSARDYIQQEKFDDAGITLEFMEYDYPEYPQLHPPYDPFVTILDLLFMVGDDVLPYFVNQKRYPSGH
ncbi:MAG: WbqC family protein [Anaerolineae bacterium]|nr:WbqC family protein [Anaerolineae bacterium]MDK1081008.1 WbqC family protein [Anaerolineae bacterium]MDK1117473.1 WbqC family protein [Anaerolineae bacterium]